MHQTNIAAGSDHTCAVVGRLQIGLNRDDACVSRLLSLGRHQGPKDGQKGES